jgi:hypothetical protein
MTAKWRAKLAVAGRRGALPHDLLALIDLKARPLQVVDHPLGELLAGVIRHMLLQEAAQEIAALTDCEAERECELGTERVAGQGAVVLVLFLGRVVA